MFAPSSTELEKHLFKDFKLKLPAFARTRPLLFNRTGLSNLLNNEVAIFMGP